jgi:hypothetical protein
MFCRGIADDDDDEEEEETKSMESIGRISALEVDVQSVVELESKLLLRWRDCETALILSKGFEKFCSCSRAHTTSSTPPDFARTESRLLDSLIFSDPNKNGDTDYGAN